MPNGMKRVFLTALSDVHTSDKEGVGTIRFEGNDVYKYVKFANATATVALAAGDPVAYLADGYDVHTVVGDMTDADAAPVGAGVVQGTVAGVAGTAYYGWIQIKGAAIINTAFASGAAGNNMKMSATDKTLAVVAAVTDAVFGVAQDVTNKQVIVDCPF